MTGGSAGAHLGAGGATGRASFPRQSARTRGFTLGRPRNIAVASDGSRVAFLRSAHGSDPVNRLWLLDVATGAERLVADPADLLADAREEGLPAEERTRRERARESAGGIVAYATDHELRTAAFALAGRLFVANLTGGSVRELPTAGAVFDPRPDPHGQRVAYVAHGRLHVVDVDGQGDREVAGEKGVSWGLAEFVAAEEMGRSRGFWWGPDGRLAAARVDETPVVRWHVADPVNPANQPRTVAYPQAGSDNADVTLWVISSDGRRLWVNWDRRSFPYLARVRWGASSPLTLLVQSRDQRHIRLLVADPATGTASTVREDRDDAWVELVDGSPTWLSDGRLVTTIDLDGVRRLAIDGEPATPPGLHVRRIVEVASVGVYVMASEEPTESHLWWVPPDGGRPQQLTDGPGVHDAAAGGEVTVVHAASMATTETSVRVVRRGREVGTLASHAETPTLEPRVRLLELGPRRLRSALILPAEHPDVPLPALLDPYGGPHAQRVVKAAGAYLTAQWFAEQGFAVLIVDGRGTPGRGTGWEKAVHLDLAGPALDDQVEGLEAAAEVEPGLDLSRVAIRGWSFGGYLATLAVLRRPDRFHAAIAGAPVTDWRLYDTHYTERYLGHPDEQPDAYRRSSLLEDAGRLTRSLLLIHGLADDNVVAAHSLRLSRALLEAGRPHTFLPLAEVTHLTRQEVVAENLLHLQLDFLRHALGLRSTSGGAGRAVSWEPHREP